MKRLVLTCLSVVIFISFKVSYSEEFPKRIVSLSPSITEIIYGLGAWDKVVGVTLYSDFPPEAKDLPKVGGWVDPNLEAILAQEPDLVIMIDDQYTIFGDKIRKLGLNTLSVESNDSVKDILDSIVQIGKALGKEEEAESLSETVESTLEEIRAKTRNVPPRRVLFVIGRNPGTLEDIYVVGKTSFMNEMIMLAGGENVVEIERLAIRISKEAILSLDPDVIIEINHERTDKKDEVIEDWSGLKEAPAVRNGEVHVVSSTVLIHPSQRIAEGTRILAKILHPEIFEKYGKKNIQPLRREDTKKEYD
jgi:iron complex transport system substrate-binding protein